MQQNEWAVKLFESIDNQDADAFASFLAEEVHFQFGNAPTVHGKAEVTEVVRSFFSSIKGLRHEVTQHWHESDAVISHGMVTYTRHDDSVLRVPFANILKTRDNLIDEYLIYADLSALYGTA